MKRLIECLAEADKVPFMVKVVQGGGQYNEGDELEITKVGVRGYGDHKGEVEFAFTNHTMDREHVGWRHDSTARFELIHEAALSGTELPASVEKCLVDEDGDQDFGCYHDAVKKLATNLWKEVKALVETKSQTV